MKDMPYWDASVKELKGSRISKARRFNREGSVIPRGLTRSRWVVNPVKGYNKTAYEVNVTNEDEWICSCQYNRRNGRTCSHILACQLFIKLHPEIYKDEHIY